MKRLFRFRILRFDALMDAAPHFQDYDYETGEKKAVLEALMDIRNEQDATLAFRYSCREAICGSCAMVINGKMDLACRTMLNSLNSGLIVIEPLPNLVIQKDLLVDMEPFFEALQKVDPFLIPAQSGAEDSVAADFSLRSSSNNPGGGPTPQGYRIDDKEMERIDQFIACILCGSCYSACPVASRDERYLGPAALAKLYRFLKDPRDQRPYAHWAKVDTDTGLWGCDTVFRCNEVCPKNVRPADGIEGLRRKIIVAKIKRLFGKKT